MRRGLVTAQMLAILAAAALPFGPSVAAPMSESKPQRRRPPVDQRARRAQSAEINAWNDRVEREKADKRARRGR